MDNTLIVINEDKLNKTQLRRKRYEDTTLNKPCTIRANPNKHDTIKLFAKYGICNKCVIANKESQDFKARLKVQINGPIRWSDNFTNRDQTICIFTILCILIIYVLFDNAKYITF